MPAVDHDSIQGRCPTCGQVVSLSVEARVQLVECPRCGHQGKGALFVDIEAPLPVVLVQSPGQHAPAGEDNPPEAAVRGERALLMGDARTLLMGDERTHLRLDSALLKSAHRRASHTPASRPAGATTKRAGDEERTHLLLEPFDLKDERDTALTRMTATLRPLVQRTLRLSLALEERLHENWSAALAVLGVACGLLPPVFDYLTDDPASTSSRIASGMVFLALAAFGVAWLGRLRHDDGVWDWKVARVRVQTLARLLLEDIGELARSPRYLKLQLFGELLASVGLVGSSLAACRSLVRLLMGGSDPPSLFRFLSGLALVGGVVLLRAARRAAPEAVPGPTELGESVAAASKLPAVVDLSEPLPTSFVGEDTLLHRVVFALSEWRGREWLDEAGYRAALERHLQRHLPAFRIERERWLGRARRDGVADLIVGDLVLIEVKHGFGQRSAERALARLREHARTWPGKPMILVIFDASREAVCDGDATSAFVDLRQRLAMLTVRMPTRR
jgi:hypothetical protein